MGCFFPILALSADTIFVPILGLFVCCGWREFSWAAHGSPFCGGFWAASRASERFASEGGCFGVLFGRPCRDSERRTGRSREGRDRKSGLGRVGKNKEARKVFRVRLVEGSVHGPIGGLWLLWLRGDPFPSRPGFFVFQRSGDFGSLVGPPFKPSHGRRL